MQNKISINSHIYLSTHIYLSIDLAHINNLPSARKINDFFLGAVVACTNRDYSHMPRSDPSGLRDGVARDELAGLLSWRGVKDGGSVSWEGRRNHRYVEPGDRGFHRARGLRQNIDDGAQFLSYSSRPIAIRGQTSRTRGIDGSSRLREISNRSDLDAIAPMLVRLDGWIV